MNKLTSVIILCFIFYSHIAYCEDEKINNKDVTVDLVIDYPKIICTITNKKDDSIYLMSHKGSPLNLRVRLWSQYDVGLMLWTKLTNEYYKNNGFGAVDYIEIKANAQKIINIDLRKLHATSADAKNLQTKMFKNDKAFNRGEVRVQLSYIKNFLGEPEINVESNLVKIKT